MIPAESASYPVLGAAQACGVPYDLAQRYVEANRRWAAAWDASASDAEMAFACAAFEAIAAGYEDISAATTPATAEAFRERMCAAMADGRLFWPYRHPGLDIEGGYTPAPLPGVIDEGGDVWDGKPFDPDFPVEGAAWPK